MRVPAKTLCDLCQCELTPPHVRIDYPLDRADQQFIVTHMLQRPDAPGIVHVMAASPEVYRFDICRGCIDGLLPMLAELKTSGVRTLVLKAVDQIRRFEQS